jgi:ribulose-5-phosphate 4-epimerase/fuculose-1-phosphate aldolase
MDEVEQAVRDLVIANRILARENVTDAYGHVSVRHPRDPQRFLLSCSRSPELVQESDIMEFTFDGAPVGGGDRHPYLERFIHAAIYEARSDVNAVLHSHAEDVLPYTIANAELKPVIHSGSVIGAHVPRWDIRRRFGDTNMLVSNIEQGRDMAKVLATHRAVLMRGHGFTGAGRSLADVVRIGVYLPRNARVQTIGARLGEVEPLTPGEIEARSNLFNPDRMEMWRAWEYWATRAGCGDLLGPPPARPRNDVAAPPG